MNYTVPSPIHLQSILAVGKIFSPIQLNAEDIACDDMGKSLKKAMDFSNGVTGDTEGNHESNYNEYVKQCQWVDFFRKQIMILSADYASNVNNIRALENLTSALKSYKDALMIDLFDGQVVKRLKEVTADNIAAHVKTHGISGRFNHLDYSIAIPLESIQKKDGGDDTDVDGDGDGDGEPSNAVHADMPLECTQSWENGTILHGEKYMEHLIVSYNYAVYSLKLVALQYETMDGVTSANTESQFKLSPTYNLGLWIHSSLTVENMYTDTNRDFDWIRESLFGKRYMSDGLKEHFDVVGHDRVPKNAEYIQEKNRDTGLTEIKVYTLKETQCYVKHCENLNNLLELTVHISQTIGLMIRIQDGDMFDIKAQQLQSISKNGAFLSSMQAHQVDECTAAYNADDPNLGGRQLFEKILTFSQRSLEYRLSKEHLSTLKHLAESFKRAIHLDIMKYIPFLVRNRDVNSKDANPIESTSIINAYIPKLFLDVAKDASTPNTEVQGITGAKKYFYQWCSLCSQSKYLLHEISLAHNHCMRSESLLLNLFNDKKRNILLQLAQRVTSIKKGAGDGQVNSGINGFVNVVLNGDIGGELLKKLQPEPLSGEEKTYLFLKSKSGDFRSIPSSAIATYCEASVTHQTMCWLLHLMFHYAFIKADNVYTRCNITLALYSGHAKKLSSNISKYRGNCDLRNKAKKQLNHLSDLFERLNTMCSHYNVTIFRDRVYAATEAELNPKILTKVPDGTKKLDYYVAIKLVKRDFKLANELEAYYEDGSSWRVATTLLLLAGFSSLRAWLNKIEFATSFNKHIRRARATPSSSSSSSEAKHPSPLSPYLESLDILNGHKVNALATPTVGGDEPFKITNNAVQSYGALYGGQQLTGGDYVQIFNDINEKIKALFMFLNNMRELPSKETPTTCIGKDHITLTSDETNDDCLKLLALHLMLNGGLKEMVNDVVRKEAETQHYVHSSMGALMNMFKNGGRNSSTPNTNETSTLQFNEGIQVSVSNLSDTHKKQCIEYLLSIVNNTLS